MSYAYSFSISFFSFADSPLQNRFHRVVRTIKFESSERTVVQNSLLSSIWNLFAIYVKFNFTEFSIRHFDRNRHAEKSPKYMFINKFQLILFNSCQEIQFDAPEGEQEMAPSGDAVFFSKMCDRRNSLLSSNSSARWIDLFDDFRH